MFDRFGYFRTEREHYDRDYELTEEGRVYWINRFDLWERSTDEGGAPLPYAERTVRPIIYYLSPEFPEARVGDAMQVGRWWNEAFVETVESLGADPGEDVFRVVPNTYAVDDAGAITDFGQRNGDLRYNHLYWVDDPQFEALLGYGPSGADPLTGEIIAADAYVYGAAIDSYGTYGADIIDLMRGDILESEFIEGEHVGAYLANLRDAGTPEGRDAVRDRVQRVLDGGAQERMRNVRERGPRAFERQHDWVGARLKHADDNPLFDALWSDELRSAYESHFGRPLRPSEFGGRRLVRALQRHRRKLGARAVDLRAFDDESMLHLVRELEDAPREEVVDTIRSYIFKSTAAHEIGHTLGLRHNFAASTDALNFSDTYWDIRDPAARTLDLPSAAEQAEGLREHAYSSLMDYSAKFIGDIRGLGRYDVAAIKFGYGQLVEVFDSPVTHPLALRDDDGDGDPEYGVYELEDLGDFIHYTSWPDALSTSGARDEGVANMRARSNMPYEDVVGWLRREDGAESFRGRVVPYKFCSDEYDGAEWDCATFDEGADPYEIVSFAAQDHRDYYIFRAFKRHRRFVDPIDYYYSTYWRAMFPMSTQYQMWVFDQWWKAGEYDFLDYWGWFTDDAALTAFRGTGDWNTHPDGGLAAASASVAAVNFLAEVIAMPEPGSYWQDPSNPGTLIWWTADEDVICGPGEDSAVDPCSDIYIPVTPQSRYALSEFDPGSGYYWYEKVSVIGSFWDKLAAIETLSDPSTYFLGVDDVADYSTYVIGFNVAFPQAVDTLFGSIINEDYAKFGAEATPEGGFIIRPYLNGSDELGADRPLDGNTAVIDPATNFTVSLYTMWYGMALLNANFDQSFNDNAKIWLEGSGEAFTPDPSLDPADIATFNNPFNGRVYKSVKSTDPTDYSLGFEVVSRAATLADYLTTNDCVTAGPGDAEYCDSRRWELQLLIENVELMRGYYDFLGYAWW